MTAPSHQLRILHIGDIHVRDDDHKPGPEPALQSLATVRDRAARGDIDLVALAGDLWDGPIWNTEASGFTRTVELIRQILEHAPIAAIYGTPTHDIPGCYEVLRRLRAAHKLTVLEPGVPYFLTTNGTIFAEEWSAEHLVPPELGEPRLFLQGIPEPTKGRLYAAQEGIGRREAADQVRKKLTDLLFGFAACRKKYGLPSLLLYHGATDGAPTCTGHVLQAGEISISRQELSVAGADYYACGHIHLAQQIGSLPAYYCGSAWPVNFGELDQKSFNVVTFDYVYEIVDEDDGSNPVPDGLTIDIERIPYPHPPLQKIVAAIDEVVFGQGESWLQVNGHREEIDGCEVWLVLKVPPDGEPSASKEQIEEELRARGAVGRTHVKIERQPRETVRTRAVIEARSLAQKVAAYALDSGDELGADIERMADELETELSMAGIIPAPRHFRLKHMKIRGAIGIWKGLGRDELELDFDRYEPGLLALVGPNGAGKTTILENAHPWPSLLTIGDHKLQDHFRLKDSYRDVTFVDEISGEEYRCRITIDGKTKTGRCDYELYRSGQALAHDDAGAPLTDDRKASYERMVQRIFGSRSLFLLSVYTGQKGDAAVTIRED